MPANHMGVTEGTVGRNVNELDFLTLGKWTRLLGTKSNHLLSKKGLHLCPVLSPYSPDKQEFTHSALTDPGFTVGHSTTNSANCCHIPWEACLAKQNNPSYVTTPPSMYDGVSAAPALLKDIEIWQTNHRDSWNQHKPQYFPIVFPLLSQQQSCVLLN